MSRRSETAPHRPVGTLIGAGRRRERQAEEFIGLIRQAAALLQAGRSLHGLWAELATLQEPCAAGAASDHRRPGPPGCCLHHLLRHAAARQRLGDPPFHGATGPGRPESWRQLQACVDLAGLTGAALAELLTRMADALEDGQDAHQARQSAIAGPRSTARLLMGLPWGGLALSLAAGASATELLAGSLGWVILGTGGALTVVGHLWTRALIRTAEAAA